MILIKEQEQLLLEISRRLKRKIEVYAIGGTAMMFHGLKEETLDIDLVFNSEKDRKKFIETVRSFGFREMDARILYGGKANRPIVMILGDYRLDLFLFDVVDFYFSESMKRRAASIHEFDRNLLLKIADVHDIVIMKCATKRLKDEDDIVSIVKDKRINWKIIVDEVKEQVNLGRETALLSLGTLLEKLRERHKIGVPNEVLDELWELLEKQVSKKRKKVER